MSISDTTVSVATTCTPSKHACRAQKESRASSGVFQVGRHVSLPLQAMCITRSKYWLRETSTVFSAAGGLERGVENPTGKFAITSKC